MSIDAPDPNPALDAILTGRTGRLEFVLSSQSTRVKNLYQAKVGKKTGRLAQSATSYVEKRPVIKGQARLVGVVTVGGLLPVSRWNSARNTNPGGEFYYGVFHEFGTHTEGTPGQSLSPAQERRLAGLERLAADRAASPGEAALARKRANSLKTRKKGTKRIRVHPAANDLKAVVREMGVT